MAARYDEAALGHLAGDGLLYPRVLPVPSDTGLVSRPPGYPFFVAQVYRLLGTRFAAVQLVQNALGALLPVLLCLTVASLFGRHAGVLAGTAAVFSAPLAFYGNVVTPDSLGALLAVGVVAVVWWRGWRSRWALVAGGLLLGAATWLRPNFLLLAPFFAAGYVLASPRRRSRVAPWALGLAVASALVVSPVTLRNLAIYGELVPVSINMGIVLWEGIADAGGERFGARSHDWEVAASEAKLYDDPRYGAWWASPDGIKRDRDRLKRSLAVIRAEPAWFLSGVLKRGAEILAYGTGGAPPLLRKGQVPPPEVPRDPFLRPGRLAGGSRPIVALVQRALASATLPMALVGMALLAWLCPRRLALWSLVPAYHLLTQMPLHYEPRFVLPMHAFMLALAAVGVLGAAGLVLAKTRYSPGMGDRVVRTGGEGRRA
jgi:hypothetical protein